MYRWCSGSKGTVNTVKGGISCVRCCWRTLCNVLGGSRCAGAGFASHWFKLHMCGVRCNGVGRARGGRGGSGGHGGGFLGAVRRSGDWRRISCACGRRVSVPRTQCNNELRL